MDPLSVSASIIALLSAAGAVTSILGSMYDAHAMARRVTTEVTEFSAILRQLQTFLDGSVAAVPGATSMILVEQVLVTLSGCVATFSELEDVVTKINVENGMGKRARLAWAVKGKSINETRKRLRTYKLSLTLMLTILECESLKEARRSQDRLTHLVERVLESNVDMARRLRELEVIHDGETVTVGANPKPSAYCGEADTQSTVSSFQTAPELPPDSTPEDSKTQHGQSDFAFDDTLRMTRVYRKFKHWNASTVSAMSSTTCLDASSMLSGLSLADIPRVSMLALPILGVEADMSRFYKHAKGHDSTQSLGKTVEGDFPIAPEYSLHAMASPSLWDPTHGWQAKLAEEIQVSQMQNDIFGVPSESSIGYSNIVVALAGNGTEIWGYLPTVVVMCGEFLKRRAIEVDGIFESTGTSRYIEFSQEISRLKYRNPEDFSWIGYTAHDAASVLVDYLCLLPKPVIVLESYPGFTNPFRNHVTEAIKAPEHDPIDVGGFDKAATIRSYQELIKRLPLPNQHLLLYLIDLLAAFNAKSDINKTGANKLAKAFQPGLLSPGSSEASEDEARLCQGVVAFLIENRDHFMLGLTPQPRYY